MAYKLFLMFDGSTSVHLDGASMAAPVKGARYSPGLGARRRDELGREVISEEIKIDLAGTYRAVTDWIQALDVELEAFKSGAWHKTGILAPRLCMEEPDEGSAQYWWSDLVTATLELDPAGLAQRALGHQLVTLKITRLDRWLYLGGMVTDIKFPDGNTLQSVQGYMLNHYDSTAGHSNWGYIDKAVVPGSLAAECVLQVTANLAGRSLGDIYLGCGWTDDADPAYSKYVNTLQESDFTAGAGVTKTNQADASNAGGNYADFTWATAGEVEICSATVPQRLYSAQLANGRPFKPLFRLHAGLAASDVWLKAKVFTGGTTLVLSETDWTLYPSGSPIIELPPVYIPPAGVREGSLLTFCLYALRPSTTSYTLKIDFCQLWPVDGGFRKLKCMSYMSGLGMVVDSATAKQVWWDAGGSTTQKSVYYGLGQPIRLMPGKYNVIAVANITAGNSWLIDDRLLLTFNALPCKRDL